MALVVQKEETDFLNVKKCGEVTTLLSIGKNEFFLNCGFCDYTFLQFENFMHHMYEDHLSEFQQLKYNEEDVEIQEGLENVAFSAKLCKTECCEDGGDNDSCIRDFERVDIQLDSPEKKNEHGNIKEGTTGNQIGEDCYTYPTYQDINSFGESGGTERSDKNTKNDLDKEFVADEEVSAHAIDLKSMFSNTKMQAIFSSYMEHPALWDKESGIVKNYNQKKQLFKSIASDVGMPDEWENIRKLIKKLRAKLQTEIIRKNFYESRGRLYTPSWYTDITSFLKQRSRKPKQGKQKQAKSDEPFISKEAKLKTAKNDVQPFISVTDEQCVTLAELYKGFPCLWDEQDITYRFSNRRQEALAVLHKEFNAKTGLNLTRYDLESEIGKLRKVCSKEKKQKLMLPNSESVYKPTCPYYNHIAFLEVNVGPFECAQCGKILSGIGQYKVHLSSHDGSLPYKCHLCDHDFRLPANLTVHLRRHVHDYTYTCKVCDKSFATSTDLKIHMRSHTGEKPYFCDICGKSLQTASLFSTHMQRHENRPRHKCEICSKPFYTKVLLREHMNAHLKIRDKICNICNKGFSSGKHLRQHKQIHATKKKYFCKICEKRFAQYAGLSGHMKSHGTTLANLAKNLD